MENEIYTKFKEHQSQHDHQTCSADRWYLTICVCESHGECWFFFALSTTLGKCENSILIDLKKSIEKVITVKVLNFAVMCLCCWYWNNVKRQSRPWTDCTTCLFVLLFFHICSVAPAFASGVFSFHFDHTLSLLALVG